jgi:hypothetical protein
MRYKKTSIEGEELLTQGEILLRNLIYDSRNEFRELMERWDNRLTLENLNILEKYHQGRLRVALHLNVAGHLYYACFSTRTTASSKLGDLCLPTNAYLGNDQSRADKHGQKPMMFIDNVQVVESIQGVIPSSVWLYDISDESDNVRRDSLYCSVLNGLYTFLPCFSKWETGLPGGSATAQTDKLVRDVIESGTQIMDDVTHALGNPFGYLIEHLKHQRRFPCLRVLLDVDTVKVSLRECGKHVIELVDKLIGPFDL